MQQAESWGCESRRRGSQIGSATKDPSPGRWRVHPLSKVEGVNFLWRPLMARLKPRPPELDVRALSQNALGR
jgi:hypothetical protein